MAGGIRTSIFLGGRPALASRGDLQNHGRPWRRWIAGTVVIIPRPSPPISPRDRRGRAGYGRVPAPRDGRLRRRLRRLGQERGSVSRVRRLPSPRPAPGLGLLPSGARPGGPGDRSLRRGAAEPRRAADRRRGARPPADAIGAIEVFSLSVDAGSGLRSGGPLNQRLRIALPDGGDVTCEVTRAPAVNGVEVIEGAVAGNPLDRCALFVKDGDVTGDIAVGSERYRVVPLAATPMPWSRSAPTACPKAATMRPCRRACRGGASEASGPSRPATCEGAGDRGTIDILVLYTPLVASRQDIDVLVAKSMAQLDRASRMLPGDRFGVTLPPRRDRRGGLPRGRGSPGRPRPPNRPRARLPRRGAGAPLQNSTAPTSSI